MLFFGTYSFDVENYSPDELGVQGFMPDDRIVVRQKIFHIWWIPVFPIGKMYAFKRSDELYEVPADVEEILESLGPHRTPFYSFTLLILVGLFFGATFFGIF